jgi:GTP-binding protein
MFVDEITLHMKAGKGGDGVVRWRQEKGIEKGGPSGGNGGKGGDVIAVAVRDIGILAAYRNAKDFEAGDGAPGSKSTRQGREGEDIEVKLPVGSRITNLESGHSFELMKEGERAVLLKGGRGGLGNEHFKASTNVRPRQYTLGEAGEEADFKIDLLLIVDIGLIGFPNAGKSSMMNALTAARSKVGDFPFTTLEPSLGMLYGLILADIPGLIEGAAEGRGLGHKFLRHIERTKALVHCVSAENEDVGEAYRVVRKELELYNKDITEKPEIAVLTKTDLLTPEEREEKLAALRAVAPEAYAFSIIDDASVKALAEVLTQRFA